MNKSLYVAMDRVDGKWVPAVGGGSSTTPSIRAFDNIRSAEKSMKRLNKLRNYKKFDGGRRVAKFKEVEDDDI